MKLIFKLDGNIKQIEMLTSDMLVLITLTKIKMYKRFCSFLFPFNLIIKNYLHIIYHQPQSLVLIGNVKMLILYKNMEKG